MSTGTTTWTDDLVTSYDRTAESYATIFFSELERKPFDCQLLDDFVTTVQGRGLVCDLGCGPGHVARYLKARGVQVMGVDLSPCMIDVARRLSPDIPFSQGNMLQLEMKDQSLAGVVAFYSMIHLQRKQVPDAAAELYRVLIPDGQLLVAVHGGEGEVHSDQFLGEAVSFHATFFHAHEMVAYLQQAGFAVEAPKVRPPYPFEYQSQRVYISAHRPQQ